MRGLSPGAGAHLPQSRRRLDCRQCRPRCRGRAARQWVRKAEQAYDQAEKLWSGLAARFRDVPHYQEELATTELNRATLRHSAGHPADALGDYQAAAARLSRLADQFRSVPEYRQLLASARVNLGQFYRAGNQPREAEKAWREAIAVLTTLTEQFPAEQHYRQQLGRAFNELAIALAQQNRAADARVAFADAVPHAGKAGARPARVRRLLAGTDRQPRQPDRRLLAALSVPAEAEASAHRLIAAQERRLATLPATPALQHDLARSEKMYADILIRAGKKDEARPHLEAACRDETTALVGNPQQLAYRKALCCCSAALIDLLLEQGEHVAAARVLRDLVAAVPPQRGRAEITAPEQVAAYLARCLALAAGEHDLTQSRREELKRAYGDEAMSWLRRAVDQGYTDGRVLQSAVGLAPLHDRDDFRQLVGEVSADHR